MRLSLRLRLPLTYLLVIALASIGSTLIVSPFLREHFLNERKVALLTQGSIIANVAREEILGDGGGLPYLTHTFARQLNARVLILGMNAKVLADAYGELEGQVLLHPEVQTSLTGQSVALEQRAANGEAALYVLVPISRVDRLDDGHSEIIGAVFISSSLADIYETLTILRRRLALGALAISFVAALMGLSFASAITSPLVALTEGARRMSRGTLGTVVEPRGDMEVFELAAAFNHMSSRLEALELARRRFVSDASHEMRAPLAAMKALIEPLTAGPEVDRQTAQEFLGDVEREIERLSKLVDDLLQLARLDSRPVLERTLFDFGALITRVVGSLQPLARARGIEVEVDVPFDLLFNGDENKLHRAVLNIVDNAIKFASSTVRVSCSAGPEITVKVSDDGPGVPEESRARIFERFYRVDKARARATGGSGLGLAIAAEIVAMHGGKINLNSESPSRTHFLITLPHA